MAGFPTCHDADAWSAQLAAPPRQQFVRSTRRISPCLFIYVLRPVKRSVAGGRGMQRAKKALTPCHPLGPCRARGGSCYTQRRQAVPCLPVLFGPWGDFVASPRPPRCSLAIACLCALVTLSLVGRSARFWARPRFIYRFRLCLASWILMLARNRWQLEPGARLVLREAHAAAATRAGLIGDVVGDPDISYASAFPGYSSHRWPNERITRARGNSRPNHATNRRVVPCELLVAAPVYAVLHSSFPSLTRRPLDADTDTLPTRQAAVSLA